MSVPYSSIEQHMKALNKKIVTEEQNHMKQNFIKQKLMNRIK